MASQVNLADILSTLGDGRSKSRSGLLDDLKYVLGHNQENHSLEPLHDTAFQRIFESLFKVVSSDRTAYLSASKEPTKKTTVAAATRLSTSASTLRYVISVSLRTIKSKTVQYVLAHLLSTLTTTNGFLCEPLALDYAKAIRLLLSHRPHTEHLQQETWEDVVSLALQLLRDPLQESDLRDDGRSSHIVPQASIARPRLRQRTTQVQVAEEMLGCLRSLTDSTNVSLHNTAHEHLQSAMLFLEEEKSLASSVNEDAFGLINNIVTWATSENVDLVKSAICNLLRLVKRYWQAHKHPTLKSELIILLVQTQSFVSLLLRSDNDTEVTNMRVEVKALYEVILEDYSKKPERDQLQQTDIRLKIAVQKETDKKLIKTGIFELRSLRASAEHNWAVLTLLAQWAVLLLDEKHPRYGQEDADGNGSHKRVRLTLELDELGAMITDDNPTTKVTALQIVTFLGQTHTISPRRHRALLSAISLCCMAENHQVATWAFLAAASLVTQREHNHLDPNSSMDSIWQTATRAITNTGACRAACHYLHIALRMRLTSQSTISDLIQQLAVSLDLSGPAVLADSSAGLLREVLCQARISLPGLTDDLSQRILAWFAKKWTPSKFEVRSYLSFSDLYDMSDLRQLIYYAIGEEPVEDGKAVHEWGAVGAALAHADANDDILAYLLLRDDSEQSKPTISPLLCQPCGPFQRTSVASQSIILGHLLEELPQVIEAFKSSFSDHARNLTAEACKLFCTVCHLAIIVSNDLELADTRRTQQLQTLSNTLLQEIETCASGPECSQNTVDTILRLSSQVLYKKAVEGDLTLATGSSGTALVAKSLLRILTRRQQHDEFAVSQDQSTFRTDFHESQDSRRSSQAQSGSSSQSSGLSQYGTQALRCTVSIHALILDVLEGGPIDSERAELISKRITQHLSSAPGSSSVYMLRVLGQGLLRKLHLSHNDVESIIDLASQRIMSTYTYSRSTMALSSVVSFMVKTVPHWTDVSNKSLSNLGLDMYEWFINLTLMNQVLAPEMQRKTADLLLAVCRQDPNYGSQTTDMSARTSLFKLLRKGPISVQFYLAPRLSSIFELYSVSTHDQIFDDLQKSLPVDLVWREGMAMRLYILAELGSTWHSLLRICVYYIFETAGEATTAIPYARRCITRLTASLSLDSSVKLFALFCPQLLHTWFHVQSLRDLPFQIFGYSSIKAFLLDNQDEIAAQLFLREKRDDLVFLTSETGKSVADMLSRAVDRAFAYAVSQDTTIPTESGKEAETRLREVIGKDSLKRLIYSNYGAIIGRILLATNRDDSDEKWLGKKPAYSNAASALSAMKAYSQSTRALPLSHEPHFTSKHLLDQLERLARRIGHKESSALWTTSSYTLASQMLFDSIDPALGSMHSCAVFQKLRLLIALAEQIPLDGYPLEHTIRLLVPFLEDEQCADDVIGILHHLLTKGAAYLSQNWTTLWSVAIQIVLRLTRLDSTSQQTPTQTSQQRETLLRMQKFRSWLLAFLENTATALPQKLQADAKIVSDALKKSTLPGNARVGSPESTLMLFLLRQSSTSDDLLDTEDVQQALRFLTRDFELPSTYAEDCLNNDAQALLYAKGVWIAAQQPDMDDGFVLWAALVAGRAFASTGAVDLFASSSKMCEKRSNKDVSSQYRSQQIIAEHLQALLRSSQAQTVSVALSTMRACMANFKVDAERLAFEKLFLPTIVEAVIDAPSQYHKASVVMPVAITDSGRRLTSVLAVDASIDVDQWITQIGLTICSLPRGSSSLSGLSLLLNNEDTAGKSLLPSMVHLVLLEDSNGSAVLREALSSSIQAHLSTDDTSLIPKQRFLIQLLLYLLDQAVPGESTQIDRMRWLDCDYMVAAECAVRCQMPATALMLAEMARTILPVSKRTGGRASSMSQPMKVVPNDLLLSVFQQVSEPDSYYGVEQPASLQSFLDRSEYEGNSLQALVSRSAQLDNKLRATHNLKTADASHIMKSLSALNLDSLTLALAQANPAAGGTSAVMLDTARVLQQWDINIPDQHDSEGLALYRAFHALHHATERTNYLDTLKDLTLSHARQFAAGSRLSLKWASALASISEIMTVVTGPEVIASSRLCDLLHEANTWMELADFDSIQTLVRSRSTIAGVLSENSMISESLQLAPRQVKLHEAKALVMLSDLARKHERTELAMSAVWQLNSLTRDNADISSMAQREIASVLSSVGESAASIKILRDLTTSPDLDESTQIGQAGLLSQIGQQLANARLEAPREILQNFLEPSIEHLRSQTGVEAGEVFYTFAAFCDAQLQSADALAEFQRLSKLRQAKHDEAMQLKAHVASLKSNDAEYKVQKRSYERAMQWFKIDNAEYIKLRDNRVIFAEQSLKNYMHTLRASNKHDLCVLRLFALWLEYSDSKQTQSAINKHLPQVPTWKFVLLMNQLMSRLKGDRSEFDKTLLVLLQSICSDHPYHTVHHLYAARKFPGDDPASQLRRDAAEQLCRDLVKDKSKGEIIRRMLKADSLYKLLATESRDGRNNGQYALEDSMAAGKISRHVPREQVPSATVDLALEPDGVYENVPVVTGLANTLTIMTGLSAPKVLTIYTSDGKHCKQLFKGGNDDLRQDAIMEQVFGEVSKMLRNHKASRQRNLQVRTYKVIPLTNRAGIIEFVPDSIPINDFLQPAHQKYYPNSMKVHAARQKISAVAEQSTETRVKEFRKVCEQMPPVMRHFFFERFRDPDEWFAKRTAYTRTTAAISMLGQILGLGDRHCHNILLDEQSGEVIHIDLGVAFEAGRVLPIPELVPFRLTRDIIDGMGITGTEGTFKRCAEFTLDALRKDKDGIMTLLNVLRYDPLYSWTLSPVRAKRMQQQEGETNATSAAGLPISNKTESEAGEAERALSIVEKKLGNALSTAASVSEMIQQATDDKNLATLFSGWAAFF